MIPPRARERGKTDVFELTITEDIGELQSITLIKDTATGMHMMHPEWLCDSVMITTVGGASAYQFICDQWFSKSDGLKHTFQPTSLTVGAASGHVAVPCAA